jgi:hypothetical protein
MNQVLSPNPRSTCTAAPCTAAHPQVGIGLERILRDFHPDAEDLWGKTTDLQLVTQELADPTKRVLRRVGGRSNT